MKFYKNSHSTFYSTLLLSIVSMVSIVFTPSIALASSWSPTLLVNTEAFQVIDDGDGTSDIELRFGTSGKEFRWNITDSQFELDAGLEVQGTASGNIIHAQDTLTSSGGLVVEGAARFNSTVTLNGVTYTFPFGDASASGKILSSDGSGNLTWTAAGAADTSQLTTFNLTGDSGTPEEIGQGATLDIAGGAEITTVVSATDTVTIDITDNTIDFTELESGLDLDTDTTVTFGSSDFVFNLDSTGDFEIQDGGSTVFFVDGENGRVGINTSTADTDFEVVGTISGSIIHAQDTLTSSGTLSVGGAVTFGALTSCTNLTTDANGVISCNNTDYITETELDSEAELETQLADVSNVIVETEIDSESELEAIVGIDFIKDADIDTLAELEGVVNTTNIIIGADIDTESELEAILTDVTNVFTNNDGTLADDDLSDNDTDDLSEGSSNLYFTNERVDDRINGLFEAGSGITFNYDDTNGIFTVNTGFSSGAQVSLSPEYAGAVYYGTGANNVGQMVLAYDSTNKENFYKWNSTVATLQDYNIAVRVKVPDEFTHWDGTAPIEFRYRTNAASSDDNQIDITMLDTAGSAVSLTGGGDLANTSWNTASITGPEAAGTYTPGSYVTIIIAMQARVTNTGEAHAGYLNLNWTTKKR